MMNGFVMDGGMGVFGIIFTVIFIAVFGIIIYSFFMGAKEWSKNNKSPILTVDAKLIAKRTNVSRHSDFHGEDNHMHSSHTSTSYYITFEVQSGSRMEFLVTGEEYGMVIEGDIGKLTFQGTRYKGFDRL